MMNSRIQVASITEEDEVDSEVYVAPETYYFSEEERLKNKLSRRNRKSGLSAVLQQNNPKSFKHGKSFEKSPRIEKSSSDEDLGSENSTSYGIPILKPLALRILRAEKINTKKCIKMTSSLPSSPILRHKSLSNPPYPNKTFNSSSGTETCFNCSFFHKFQVEMK